MSEQENVGGSEQVTEYQDDEIQQMAAEAGAKQGQEGFSETTDAIALVLQQVFPQEGEKFDRKMADNLIADIDKKLGAQLDEVLHNKDFQELESAWRGLKLVIDRTEFRENIQIRLLNVSKDDLAEDFKDSPEIPQSGLYHHIYSSEYGTFGGKPYGAIIGNYSFTADAPDIQLLRNVAAVSAMSHAPFAASANPRFFPKLDGDRLPARAGVGASGFLRGPRGWST